MKINFGKGLLRLYLLIYLFWLLIGLGYFYKALAPHVGINYWTKETYISRIKEACNGKTLPSDDGCNLPDGTVLVSVNGYPSALEIENAPKDFFNLFVYVPIIFLLIFSAIYIGLKWVFKGFKKDVC